MLTQTMLPFPLLKFSILELSLSRLALLLCVLLQPCMYVCMDGWMDGCVATMLGQ